MIMKKITATLLALVLALSMLPMQVLAAPYSDVDGHWAEDAIERWSDYGVIQGNKGKFQPYGTLTRAHLATILARLLALPEAESAGFADTAGHWAEDAIDRCAAAGILLGDDGKAFPNAPVSRQQAMTMIARALGYRQDAVSVLEDFLDADKISGYAAGYLAALVNDGVVLGHDDYLEPYSDINRGQMVAIIDRMIDHYANRDGQTLSVESGGYILVVAEDVTLTDVPADAVVVATKNAAGLTVNGVVVAPDQEYTVPEKSPASDRKPPHRHSYDETTLRCACGDFHSDVVATVNDANGYTTLAAAFAAAKSGDHVVLIKDETLDATKTAANDRLTITKPIALTLRAKLIAPGELEPTNNFAALFISADTTINANENGGIVCQYNQTKGDCGPYGIYIGNNADVTINGGFYHGGGTAIQVTTGSLTIQGGQFEVDPYASAVYGHKFLLNCVDRNYKAGTAKIIVKGGSFKDYDPSDSASENPYGNFVATGYAAKKTGDVYVVSQHTDAHAAAVTTTTDWATLKNVATCATCGYQQIDDAPGTYYIGSKADLFAFAEKVNDKTLVTADKTFVLTADITFTDSEMWTPVGQPATRCFGGTFDGQGHTIYNMKVSMADNADGMGAGFFGFIDNTSNGAVIKNLHFDGASVSAYRRAGVVVGYMHGKIQNCTVKNSAVTVQAYPVSETSYDDGDKVGGITGFLNVGNEGECQITGCSVTNTSIKAYRDIGGIVGYACQNATVSGNTISGVTITIDNEHDYKNYGETKTSYDANDFVGEADSSATVTGNTGAATIGFAE